MNYQFFEQIELPAAEIAAFSLPTYPYTLPLQPAGYETQDTESMSSYLCRLAETSLEMTLPYTRRLIQRYCAEQLPASIAGSPSPLWSVNGCQKYSERLSLVISTVQQDKIDGSLLTLLPLRYLTDQRGRHISKIRREWCRECWLDDVAKSQTPYVRLYWLIHGVKICCTHNTALQKFCANCGVDQACLSLFPRQWICNHCGYTLYKGKAEQQPYSKRDKWVADSIYRLMDQVYQQKNIIHKSAVKDSICHLLHTTKLTYNRLAEDLNVSPRILKNAYLGKGIPLLSVLIDLCYRIETPIDQFILKKDNFNFSESWRQLPKTEFVEKKNISKEKKAEIKIDLEKILKNNPSPPVKISHIAMKYSISYTVLEYHFPRETKKIRNRWTEWVANKNSDAKKERINKLMKSILALVKKGIYPSDRQLRDRGYLLPSDLRREEIRTALRALQSSYKMIGAFRNH